MISDTDSPTEPYALFLLSLDAGEKRKLTDPPAHWTGDSSPAFSPDGRTLVFTRHIDAGLGDVYECPSQEDSSPREKQDG